MNTTATTEYIVSTVTFDSYWENLVFQLSETCGAVLFYGFYLVLCSFAIRSLACRRNPRRTIFLAVCGVMFVFATTQIILRLASSAVLIQMTQKVVTEQKRLGLFQFDSLGVLSALSNAEHVIFTLNNLAADLVFVELFLMIYSDDTA
ncbi:hypothetical protein GGX14DRAFT_434236 [Mycena pura]|uniref:Uncharacterized protein n=1 Tax=Mycena pura TaxID=153505 RepID=A0AAD6YKI5_9AGAR|nr:hypothetical protein GGX14DRAFT_434236 [Mycena pura]